MAGENDVLTRDNDGNLAVRTVSSTGDNYVNPDDVYTRDSEGKLCVRTTGEGGGGGSVDYNRVIEKSATIPAATSSNVGKVYMYTGETNATYTHGYIYENQTVSEYEDTVTFVPATISGTVVSATSNSLATLAAEYITGDITSIVSGTMTYDSGGNLWVFVGKDSENTTVGTFQIYQEDYEDAGFTFTGTPENGDVVAFTCTITESTSYAWVRIDVQPAGGSDSHNLGWYADLTALQTAHPTGSNGDFAILGSTDTVWVWDSGTSAWKDTDTKGQVTSVNGQTGVVVLTAGDVGAATAAQGAKADTAVQPADLATVATTGAYSDLSGTPTIPMVGNGTITITQGGVTKGTFTTNQSGDTTIDVDADTGQVIQVATLPTASADELDHIYQFTGTTDTNYTNGYFYKCVSDGATPAVYSWEAVEVQAGGGGSSYTAGTGIDITGGVISVTSPTLQNYTTASSALQIATTTPSTISTGSFSTAVGVNSYVLGANGIAIGRSAYIYTNATASIAIGSGANSYNHKGAIIIGGGSAATQGNGTFSVSLSTTGVDSWNTYKVLDSDGTIPTARLTKVNSTITLTAAGWSSNTQTVNVTGMTATGIVFVSPDPTDQADYTSAGIYCSAQAAGTLTFTCSTTPANDIDVVVVML